MTDRDDFLNDLYNHCYDRIAEKPKWSNRDFDDDFDYEVDVLYSKICKLLNLME